MLYQKNIYSDLPMFITPNAFTGDISVKKDQGAIQQAIKNIILTKFGERPLEPNFGSEIYQIIFENPVFVEFYGGSTISSNVTINEPRVNLENITYDVQDKQINIDIQYYILSLNVKNTLDITLQRTR